MHAACTDAHSRFIAFQFKQKLSLIIIFSNYYMHKHNQKAFTIHNQIYFGKIPNTKQFMFIPMHQLTEYSLEIYCHLQFLSIHQTPITNRNTHNKVIHLEVTNGKSNKQLSARQKYNIYDGYASFILILTQLFANIILDMAWLLRLFIDCGSLKIL